LAKADDARANRAITEAYRAGRQAAKEKPKQAVFKPPVCSREEVGVFLQTVKAPTLAKVLDKIVDFISDYVFFDNKAKLYAVALWTFHTHVIDQFEVTPYLHIGSAEKRSGKTRLFEVLELLVKNPWHSVNPSEAVFYRKIGAHKPTILLDEIDAIWNHKTAAQYEGLRAAINAGYRRGATVDRCAGPRGDRLEAFPVFCAKALAGIGKLPETIADRCIHIDMVRKTKDEKTKRFRSRNVQLEAEALHADIAACASELKFSHIPDYHEAQLNDRAEEVWEPLIWIADKAGGHWPSRAREAALTLSAGFEPEDDSLGVHLLADCRMIFEDAGVDRITSAELLKRLNDLEESPWDDFGLTTRRLASMLKHYGIKPATHRFEDRTVRGYLKSDFKDAWNRYLPLNTDLKCNIRNNGLTMRVLGQNQSATENEMLRFKNSQNACKSQDVADVADKTPNIRTTDCFEPELKQLKRQGRLSI
jgi:hypothetical protein